MKQFDPIYTANDKNLIKTNCKNINLILGDNKTIKHVYLLQRILTYK